MRIHHFLLFLALLVPFTSPAAAVNGTWQNLGPDGGSVYSLAFEPGDPRVMYAGVEGGAYKSVDGGATWTEISRGFDVGSPVSSFAFDAANRRTVYAAQGTGLYWSGDGGQSWSEIGPRNAGAFDVAAHPTVSGTVYAATLLGLYRSTNADGSGGASWKLLTRGLPQRYRAILVAVDPASPNRLYLTVADLQGSGGGLYRSDNGGNGWQRISSRTANALAFDARAPRTLYAAIGNEIYRSTNAGKSWKRLGMVTASSIETLAVDPARRNVLYAGGFHGFFRSEDGGRTWAPLFTGLPIGVFHAIAVSPAAPQTLFTGVFSDRRGGVYQSTDGGSSWRLSSRGLSAMAIRSLAVHPRAPGTVWAVANSFLFRTTDGGASWVRQRPDANHLVSRVFVDPVDGSRVFALLQIGTLRRSLDGGATWENAGAPPAGLSLLVFDPQTPSTIYAAGGGLAKSTDNGATWTRLSGDAARLSTLVLEISLSAPDTLYASGYLDGQQVILATTDGGATWTRADNGFPGFPESLAIDSLTPTTVFGTRGGIVYRSVNGGQSWSVFSNSFKDRVVFPLATSPASPNLLYAAVWFDNVYQIATGASGWEALGESPGRVPFSELVADPTSACRVYAGTQNRGLLLFTRAGCAD